MHRLLLAFSFAALLFVSCAPKEQLFYLVDPETPCTIVLELGDYNTAHEASDAHETVNWFDNDYRDDDICRTALAALELQQHLCQLTGLPASQVPIIDDNNIPAGGNLLFLGAPKSRNFKPVRKRIERLWRKQKSEEGQDFRVDSFALENHRGLVLSGKTSVAVLYAAYEILTRWGVRWHNPYADSAMAPRYERISILNMHYHVEPSFALRGFWMDARRSAAPPDSQFVAWMGRNRLNLFSTQYPFIGALKQRGMLLNAGRQDEFYTLLKPEYPYRYNHPKFPGDDQYPMDPYMVSDLYLGDLNGDKVLSYGEAHPRWFAVELNEADRQAAGPNQIQICLAQADAVQEFARTVADKLAYGEWQTCDIVDLWTPDLWCNCATCQTMGNTADKLLFVMYYVSRAIDEATQNGRLTRPIYVHGYAQNAGLVTPTVPVPKDFRTDNTAVFLFTGPRCFNHHIIDSQCADINLWFVKNLWAWLDARKLYRGDINIAENYNAEFFADLPTVHSNIMDIDLQAYAELGVRGINTQHVRMADIGVQTLTNYQFARQCWDVRTSIDTLKQEFFAANYAEAAELVAQYYERIELAMATITTWRYYLPRRAFAALDAMSAAGAGDVKMNERFMMQQADNPINFNTAWENTYHLIFEARFILDQLLTRELPPPLHQRVADLEYQFRYAELTVNLYDNIVSFFTIDQDEEYLKQEAIIRLRENKEKLRRYEIRSPLFGQRNGMEASGVEKLIDELVRQYAN